MAYKETDVEESQKGVHEIKGGIPFWSVPNTKGKWETTRIRVCPPREDHPDNKYYFWIAVHGNLPGTNRPVLCPRKMFDQPCPACAKGSDYWDAGNQAAARKLFSSWKAFVNIVPLNKDGSLPEDAHVQVWGIPKSFFEDHFIPKTMELPKESRNFSSPIKGRDVFIRRMGSGPEDTKYDMQFCEPSEAPAEFLEMIEEGMYYLPELYPTRKGSEIAGLLVAAKEKPELPPAEDPWAEEPDTVPAEDDHADAIDAEYKDVTETVAADEPAWDDDAAPTGPTDAKEKRTTDARNKLAARLQAAKQAVPV